MNTIRARERWYKPEQYSNDESFRQMIYEAAGPNAIVFDAGAGAGDLFPYNLKGRAKRMVGVDLDPRVETNSQLDEGIVADLREIPVKSESFDVAFSRYVLEQIENPKAFLREMNRVLKPGGHYLFLTPNRWHYVSLGARLAPHSFHEWYNRKRGRE